MKRISRVVTVIVFALALYGTAEAQIQTGRIFVTARDPQGEFVPGVTVTISSPALVAGEMRGITGNDGAYRFPSLPPGTYTVTVQLSGFQTVRRERTTR